MINVIFKNFSARIIFTLVLISALSGGFFVPVANAADDGDGMMSVSPSVVFPASTNNDFTFQFTNNSSNFAGSSKLTLTIPSGWTDPQESTSGDAGFVTIANSTCLDGPSNGNTDITVALNVVTVNINDCDNGNSFDLQYNNVTAPVAGSYTFTTKTSDGSTTLTDIATSPVIVVDGTAPTITLASPDGGEVWNGFREIVWTATDDVDTSLSIDLEYRHATGIDISWHTIATGETNDGSYSWNTAAVASDDDYIVRVTANDGVNAASDESNGTFTVTLDNTNPVSAASSAAITNISPIPVGFVSSDDTSGVDVTRLYYRFSLLGDFTDIPWTNSLLAAGGTSGSFLFTPTLDGYYGFYSRATDLATNEENAPTLNDSTTIYDTTAPVITSITAAETNSLGGTIGILGIGDVLTFTLALSPAEPSATINNASSYNGSALSWTTGDGGATYTATYTVSEGDTEQSVALALDGVTATDLAGNESAPADASGILPIDANRPTVDVGAMTTTNANPLWAKTGDTVSLAFTTNEDAQTPTVTLAGEDATEASGPTSWTASYTFDDDDTQGAIAYSVTFKDLAGNTGTDSPVSGTGLVTFDRTAPDAPTVTPSGAWVNIANQSAFDVDVEGQNGATIALTATDTGAGIVGPTAGTADATLSPNLFSLTDGLITFSATLTDAAGNTSSAGTDTATKDTVAPTGTAAVSPDSGYANVGDTVTGTITSGQNNLTESGTCTVNEVDIGTVTNNADTTYTLTYNVVEGNTDRASGTLPIDCTLAEPSGNSVAVSAFDVNTLTVDANTPAAPVVTLNGGTPINLANQTSVSISGTGEAGTTAGWEISDGSTSVDGSTLVDGLGNFLVTGIDVSTLLDDPTLTLSVTLTDVAGNMSAAGIDEELKDTVAPDAPSTPDLAAGSDTGISDTDDITKDSTPTFTGDAETASIVTLYDDATEIGTDVANSSWEITSSVLTDGSHTITAKATDAAGNESTFSGGLPVTIDTELVALSLTSVAPNPTNTSPIPVTAQFSQTVNGFEVGDIVVTNGVAGSFVAVDDDTYIFDVTPAGDGGVTVNVAGGVAQDTAGNDNTVAIELSRVYDATPPTVTLVTLSDADALVKMSDSLTITATFSEDMALAPDPMITLSGLYSEGPVAMTRVDATHYTYIHTVGAGDGLVTITIADGKDLATNTLIPHSSTTFTVDNTKPVIDAHADLADVVADSVPGATITYSNPSATDVHPVSPVVTCSLPSGSVFPMGLSTITCDATDDAGNDADSTTFTVTVVPALIAKVSVSPSPTSVTVPGPVTLTINGRDAFDHITTNQSGTVVVVSADNGGALDDSLVTLASGEAMTTLTKSSAGVVHVTVSSGILSPDSETVTFTASDTTGPEVTSFSPVLDATNVSVSAPIFVNFNEPLKFSTVNGTNIQLWIATTIPTQVSATVSLVDGGTRVNVIPLSSLDFSTDYYLIVTTDVQDETGNALTTPLSDSNTGFTTAADTADHTAPTIVDKNPADSETGVAITTTPSVTFSEAMLSSTIGPTSVMLLASDDVTVIPATISLVDGGTRALITPSVSLSYSTVYHVGVTTGVTDEAGNALVAPSDTSFTTVAEPDAVLAVTGIDAVDTFAIADNMFENGWSWTFHVTVPNTETLFAMKFADFVSGVNSIPAASNIRFYSAQSSDASTAGSAITITAADTYSTPDMTLATDLDAGTAGRQIDVTVEVRVPVSTPGGSYSTSYGVKSI